MTDNRRISISIPTYNRNQFTINSFLQVLNDNRVAEIILCDDASTDGSYEVLKEYFQDESKVKIFRNEVNKDCYENKHESVLHATSNWCILFDSDNILTTEYLDAIYEIPEWDEKTVYQPQFSRPYFDFRKFAGVTITKENVAQYSDTNLMTAMNAMNFFINREQYLKVWDGSVNPGSSDSLYFNFCWLNTGGKILITPDLEYEHYISPNKDGHYQTNSHKFVEFHEKLMDKIKQLK